MSKQEDEYSETMKQGMEETFDGVAGSYEQNKSVAYAYVSKPECSLQEVIYHLMPELCLTKVLRGALHAKSNITE